MIADPSDPRIGYALDDARDAFLQNIDERRLRLFRGCLQASVSYASPLAISIAGRLGLELGDIFQAMTPPPYWPPSTGPLTPPRVRLVLPSFRTIKRSDDDRLRWRVERSGGFAMGVGGEGDWMGWRVAGDTVEVAGCIGSATLVTYRGTLRLWIPHDLPATLCAAMPGRPLASLVHHPYLADGGLAVISVDDHPVGGHVLRIRAGRRACTAPWPGLLAGIVVTHAEPTLAAHYLREA